MSGSKVLVIGLDSLTPTLTEKWAEEGRLPNLDRFIRDGVWGALRSVPNRNSAAAWSTMVTGLNPGRHGVFWFTEDDPSTYSYRFINASRRRGSTMWRVLSDEGKKVGVVNVPFTFPAEEVNGLLVAGLDAPNTDDDRFVHPPEMHQRFLDAAGGEYHVHAGVNLLTDPSQRDRGLERLHTSIDARTKACVKFVSEDDWDMFMVVFTESDVVQHYFYRQLEEPRADDPENHRTAIRDIYEHLDRAVGALIAAAGPDTTVIVVSDHGARRDEGLARALPDWLHKLGMLHYKDSPGSATKGRRGLVSAVLRRGYQFLDRRLSTETKHRLADLFPKLRNRVEVTMSYAKIDWSRTVAYTDGKRPEIWINLRGRQRQGIVEPEDANAVRQRVIDGLSQPVCRKSGEPVVVRVWRREEAYEGPSVELSPDLIVEWADEGTCRDLRYPDGREMTVELGHLEGDPVNEALSGGHSQYGIVGMTGPQVGQHPLEDANIGDIAPTVLFLLDAPIPVDVDGKVLKEAFTGDLAARDVRRGGGSGGEGSDTSYTEEEEAEIRERLQALGYVE